MPLGLPDYIKCNNASEPIIILEENQVKGMGIFADITARTALPLSLRVEGYVAVVKDDDRTYIYNSSDMGNSTSGGGAWGVSANWKIQGDDATYIHDQVAPGAASTWTVNHNLNKYPSVTVFDNSTPPVKIETFTLTYVSINQLTISFTSAGSAASLQGTAYVN